MVPNNAACQGSEKSHNGTTTGKRASCWLSQAVCELEQNGRAHGDIVPVAIAKKNMMAHGRDPDGTLLAEKNWMSAHLFVDGADKKIFGCMIKNMNNNHAFRTEKCPGDVESAPQMMMLCLKRAGKKLANKR